jgi:deazaflavin-dependent oxidoreductase (nitroreductase family)
MTANFDPAEWENSLIADMRANGGTPSQGPLAGDPLMLLYSTGAKTGEKRRSIVTYSRDGDAYVVAGSKSGAPDDPKWVGNIEKNATVEMEVANETFQGTGEVFRTGPERDRLWDQHVAALPRFGEYPAKTGGRVIPMVRLTRA